LRVVSGILPWATNYFWKFSSRTGLSIQDLVTPSEERAVSGIYPRGGGDLKSPLAKVEWGEFPIKSSSALPANLWLLRLETELLFFGDWKSAQLFALFHQLIRWILKDFSNP